VTRSRRHRLFVVAGSAAMLIVLYSAGRLLHDAFRRNAFVSDGRQDRPARVTDLGPLPPETRESSGLAVSRAHPGTFWTHNDSGDGARLYALDEGAALRATFEVSGARARDWESLDIGWCPSDLADADWCLYVADTGDNGEERSTVTLYVVEEPDPATAQATVPQVASVKLRYEGGPADVEAVAIDPDGVLALVTKGRSGEVWLYRVSSDEFVAAARSGETLVATARTRLPIDPNFVIGRWVTGASIDETGSILALRTYTEVYFFAWPFGVEPGPPEATCFLGPLEPIGEGIAFGPDRSVYLTSESPGARQGHLLEIECRGVRD
jgi:hypothetical protein